MDKPSVARDPARAEARLALADDEPPVQDSTSKIVTEGLGAVVDTRQVFTPPSAEAVRSELAMTENVENLILEQLRAIRTDIAGVKEDVREIKQRLTSLETAVAGLRRDNANLYGDVIDQQSRYDRLVERIERIERRLGLADA